MLVSKLTTQGQTTIPKEIRSSLGLKPGDVLVFEISNDKVIEMKKMTPIDYEYMTAIQDTLDEWSSKEDDVYNDL